MGNPNGVNKLGGRNIQGAFQGAPLIAAQGSTNTSQVTATPRDTYACDTHAGRLATLDFRAIGLIMGGMAWSKKRSVSWPTIDYIFEDGRESRNYSLAKHAKDPSLLALLPKDLRKDLYEVIDQGIEGTGRVADMGDKARHQMVWKGIMRVQYLMIQREFQTARSTNNKDAALCALNKALALYNGPTDPRTLGKSEHAPAHVARKREKSFEGLKGKIDQPLQKALQEAKAAVRNGDQESLNASLEKANGLLNTVFYLAALRYAKKAVKDTDLDKRHYHLAEGYAFFQIIRHLVRKGNPAAEQAIQRVYSIRGDQPVNKKIVGEVYAALNNPQVIKALGIPQELVVNVDQQL